MKKITLILLTIVLFSACENMLDEVPKSFVSKANYYQNESDAEGAIAGAYDGLAPDFFGITHYLMVALHGDYLNGRGSQAPISYFDQILDQRNIGRCASSWGVLYRTINRANAVLDNIPNIPDEEINSDVRTRILAEAHFIRAITYFELVRGWGAVPLKTSESIDLSSLEVPRSSVEDVYKLIVEDALAAESGLGEVGSATGKASKWAAKMLLAHVYLTIEDWDKAAEKALDVIKNGPFSLVIVNEADDFNNLYRVVTSTEDIMSIHHSETSQSTIPTYLHRARAYPYHYGTAGYFAWLPKMNTWIGDSWDTNDLRKQYNFYTEYQNEDGEWVSLPSTVPILFKKFGSSPDGLSTYSVPVYRYAEAFLFYAEAACMAEGSPSAQATEMLNVIKRRAYGYDINSPSPVDYPTGIGKEEFRDAVLQERGYELLLERRRWFDLKRTGKTKEAFAAAGVNIIDERMLWPIAEDEINNNPAINQADQNPGY